MSLLIIAHIFYPSGWEDLLERLLNLKEYPATFIFNIANFRYEKKRLVDHIHRLFPDAVIIETPNHGRDIGGKLAALDVALKLKTVSDLTLIIHDKQSPHTPGGITWRNELFRIIEKNELAGIFSRFQNDKKVGIVSSAKFIMNEYDYSKKAFDSSSGEILQATIKEMGLNVTEYHFVAGNIFWIRSGLIEDFFSKHSPLRIRSQLEHGNALDFHKGTLIHSWERIFSWLANMYGLEIAGI